MAQEFAKAFYRSIEWIKFRRLLIAERGPRCQKCGRIVVDTARLIGHHKTALTPQNINDVSITLSPDKVDLVCFDCHNEEPRHFLGRKNRRAYIIYGSPCSGKSTLAYQMMERGDMLLDLDKLFECISGLPLYDKPDNLRFNVFALRDKMLDMIKTRFGSWHDAYIIGGYPNKYEREKLAADLGAEVIYCESIREECLAGARARGMGQEYDRYINKWFDTFSA